MHRHLRAIRLAAVLLIALELPAAEARYSGGHHGGYAGYSGSSHGGAGGRGGYGGHPVHTRAPTGGSGGYGGAGHYPPRRPPLVVVARRPYPTSPARIPQPHPYNPRPVQIGGLHPYPPVVRPVVTPPALPRTARHLPPPHVRPVVPPPAFIPTARFVPPPILRPVVSPPASGPTARFVPPPILRPVGELKPDFVMPRPTEQRYVEGEVLILTRDGTPDSLRSVEGRLGLTALQNEQISLLGGTLHRYRLRPNADLTSTIATLRSFGVVAAAEPNFKFELEDDTAKTTAETVAKTVAYEPNPAPSSETPLQYAVEVLHLHEAHALSEGGGIRIAVIDSGLDETNPEISDRVVDRFDAVGGAFTAHRHGTAMGGAIVAHRNLVGIAPKAQLIAIRAFSGSLSVASGNGFNILRGLEFAVAHGARVVNMSFAGPRDQLLKEAIEAARRKDVVTVAAAGNGGPLAAPQYPAAEPGVIAVTATDANGTAFAGANRGSYIAVAAPGVQVLAPNVGNTIQICSGTSIATAEVSGIVALLLGRSVAATPDDISRFLSQSAHPLSVERTAGGAGVVDAVAAIRYAAAP